MNSVAPKRNYAIDWLRVFAMFTVYFIVRAFLTDRIGMLKPAVRYLFGLKMKI